MSQTSAFKQFTKVRSKLKLLSAENKRKLSKKFCFYNVALTQTEGFIHIKQNMKGLNCRSFWAKLFPNKKIVCIKFSNFDFFASCCIAQPIIIRKSFFVEKRKENVAAKNFQIGNQYFIFTFLINTFCWEKDDIFRSI